ncbi:hypothetical protein GDO81_001833, partial [Engystomops pustulosus]
ISFGQTVTQSPPSIFISEGGEVPLSCSYDQAAYNMFWYIERPGQAIKLLLSSYHKDVEEEYRDRVFSFFDKTNRRFPLNITKIRMSDTGTYYCIFSATVH